MTTPHGATGWWLYIFDGSIRGARRMADADWPDFSGARYSAIHFTYDPAEVLCWLNGEDAKPTPTDDEARRLLEECSVVIRNHANPLYKRHWDLQQEIRAYLDLTRTPGLLGGERKAVDHE